MNEDKENLIIEAMTVIDNKLCIMVDMNYIPEECQIVSKQWLANHVSQSNKALLTKLRGEIASTRYTHTIHSNPPCQECIKEHGYRQAKDQDIALIDKYLE